MNHLHRAAAAVMLVLAMASPRSTAEDREPPSLEPCPSSPNCVSSLAEDAVHRVEPFQFEGDAGAAWRALRDAISALPRTRIVLERPRYLKAECTSRLFRFVDDLEVVQGKTAGRIDLRSASRTGWGDIGVNRARVEELREQLEQAGVLRAPRR